MARRIKKQGMSFGKKALLASAAIGGLGAAGFGGRHLLKNTKMGQALQSNIATRGRALQSKMLANQGIVGKASRFARKTYRGARLDLNRLKKQYTSAGSRMEGFKNVASTLGSGIKNRALNSSAGQFLRKAGLRATRPLRAISRRGRLANYRKNRNPNANPDSNYFGFTE